MNRASILLIIEGTYPWYRGGVSEWVHQYLRYFTNIDFKILQVATDQYLRTDLNDALYKLPSHVKEFKRIPPPKLVNNWEIESERWYKSLGDDFKTHFAGVNLIHIANTGFAGWIGKKLAQQLNKPLVLTEHALYWKEIDMGAVALECGYKIPELSSEKDSMTDMFKSLASKIYEQADAVVSVSKCNMASQKRMGAESVIYIPNGVEKKWIKDSKKLNTPLTIGWIGRCAEMKHPLKFFELVEAFNIHSGVKVYFIMLACDANEPELQRNVEDKLEEYPEVQFIWNEASEKYLSGMDALCITSHNESQPLVLFEAISHKVLPIGWEAGDVTEKFGLMVPKGTSANTLSKKVVDYWSDHRQWGKKLDHLQNKVKKSHTWNHIFNDYGQLFSEYI